MRAEQERAAALLRDERALVVEFAQRLRKRAVHGTYAGLRGQDVGLTMAAMLDQEWDMSLPAAIEAEAQAQAICMQTRDFRRAYDAFVAKAAPRFEGN